MPLAVITDSEGRIFALAVCRVTFDDDPDEASDIQVTAQPLHLAHPDVEPWQTHVVRLPSHLADKPDAEVAEGLRSIHKSMYLDLMEAEPCLREHETRKQRSEDESAS